MNIWKAFSQRVIKWWRVNITSVFKLDYRKLRREQAQAADQTQASGSQDISVSVPTDAEPETSGAFHEAEIPEGTSADALEVLNRINREKEEARAQEIAVERKKREEEERIASIMNKNRNDVSAFIEEGKQMAGEAKDEAAGDAAEEQTVTASADTSEEEKAEQIRRAQEIIERLNREAAEDEAKKQAEIDAAKAAAHEAGLS